MATNPPVAQPRSCRTSASVVPVVGEREHAPPAVDRGARAPAADVVRAVPARVHAGQHRRVPGHGPLRRRAGLREVEARRRRARSDAATSRARSRTSTCDRRASCPSRSGTRPARRPGATARSGRGSSKGAIESGFPKTNAATAASPSSTTRRVASRRITNPRMRSTKHARERQHGEHGDQRNPFGSCLLKYELWTSVMPVLPSASAVGGDERHRGGSRASRRRRPAIQHAERRRTRRAGDVRPLGLQTRRLVGTDEAVRPRSCRARRRRRRHHGRERRARRRRRRRRHRAIARSRPSTTSG